MRSSSALRPALAVLAAIALLWLGAGLGSGVARGEAVYRFGVPPWQRGQSADEIRQLYRPMLDHLTRGRRHVHPGDSAQL